MPLQIAQRQARKLSQLLVLPHNPGKDKRRQLSCLIALPDKQVADDQP